jgi:uncharacterized Zn-finger protein
MTFEWLGLQGCTYRAAQQEHLATHALIHSDRKPFQCQLCGELSYTI